MRIEGNWMQSDRYEFDAIWMQSIDMVYLTSMSTDNHSISPADHTGIIMLQLLYGVLDARLLPRGKLLADDGHVGVLYVQRGHLVVLLQDLAETCRPQQEAQVCTAVG